MKKQTSIQWEAEDYEAILSASKNLREPMANFVRKAALQRAGEVPKDA